jgi:predicted outer membrane repeat protein
MARMRRVLSVTLIVIQLAAHSAPRPVQAAGVVGNGTAASCTESALAAALAGGGAIRFNCGPAPITIPITRTAEIAAPTEIDGGGRVTLDAGGRTRIFYLNKWEKHNGLRFALRDITLANGRSGGTDPQHGGCIYSRRSVIELEHVIFAGCQAQVAGGGLFAYGGGVSMSGGAFSGNHAAYGGGLYAAPGAIITLDGVTVAENRVSGDGGGIYTLDSPMTIRGGVFRGNRAEGTNGQPNAGLGGAIYTLNPASVATAAGARFEGNFAHEGGGAIFADEDATLRIEGGAFLGNTTDKMGGAVGTWYGRVELLGAEFRDNQANTGAVLHNGTGSTTIIQGGAFADNRAWRDGGALYSVAAQLTVHGATFSGNAAGLDGQGDTRGGAIVTYRSTVMVGASTFVNNRVVGSKGFGGGIGGNGTLTVVNSTFSGNSAERGGGIYYNRGAATVGSSTLAGNSASAGASLARETQASIMLVNSIAAGAPGATNCMNAVADGGGNVQSGDTTCLPGGPAAAALLGPLAMNGGSTATHALLPGSPAIDHGAGCTVGDQRGVPRPQGAACDAGAYEVATRLALQPGIAFAGEPGFTLTVLGGGFVPESVVLWNGAPRPTTYVDPGTLRVAVPAGDIATPREATVAVQGSALPAAMLRVLVLRDRAYVPMAR